jgi:uncharacterized membrane protein
MPSITKEPRREGIYRRLFDIGIFIKGFDGVLELIGGLLFLFVTHSALDHLVKILTEHELAQDPADPFSNAIVHFVSGLPDGTKVFAALYLILHGIGMVIGLWKDKLWSYPVSIGVILLFLIYQMYRLIFVHFSWPLLVFTSIDTVFVCIIWHEWTYHHRRMHKAAKQQ